MRLQGFFIKIVKELLPRPQAAELLAVAVPGSRRQEDSAACHVSRHFNELKLYVLL